MSRRVFEPYVSAPPCNFAGGSCVAQLQNVTALTIAVILAAYFISEAAALDPRGGYPRWGSPPDRIADRAG
jgi:hypothetical protein